VSSVRYSVQVILMNFFNDKKSDFRETRLDVCGMVSCTGVLRKCSPRS
jgi:hypothetical protein